MSTGETMRAIAVLGPWRGGTSLVTGILRSLGVYVGRQFFDASTTYCTFEDVQLRSACLKGFDERPGAWKHIAKRDLRIRFLHEWLLGAMLCCRGREISAIGGKHPILCKLVDELIVAWNIPDAVEFVPVSVVRSEREIHRSWTRPVLPDGSHWWPRHDREFVVGDLIRTRDDSLRTHQHVVVDFERLRSAPEAEIEKMATSLGLPLDGITNALRLVRKPPGR